MTDTTFNISVQGITWEKITDQIVAAIEGGSGYWLEYFKPKKGVERVTEGPWYADAKFWSGDFLVEAKADDDDKILTMAPDNIGKALQWLADNHLWRIEQMVKENGDAETGDVFLQACLLGDIVYG